MSKFGGAIWFCSLAYIYIHILCVCLSVVNLSQSRRATLSLSVTILSYSILFLDDAPIIDRALKTVHFLCGSSRASDSLNDLTKWFDVLEMLILRDSGRH